MFNQKIYSTYRNEPIKTGFLEFTSWLIKKGRVEIHSEFKCTDAIK